LEQRGDFLQAFELQISDKELRKETFNWINDKFKKLSYGFDTEIRLFELKNLVASHMRDIIEIDVERTIELIEKWYDDNYVDQLIVGELSAFP
jgi:hypothetical protein